MFGKAMLIDSTWLTFSGNMEAYLLIANAVDFFWGCSVAPDSLVTFTASSTGGRASSELFFLDISSSFRHKETSPILRSTFLTTTPASLHQKNYKTAGENQSTFKMRITSIYRTWYCKFENYFRFLKMILECGNFSVVGNGTLKSHRRWDWESL